MSSNGPAGDFGHTLAILHRRRGLISAVLVACVLVATIYNYTTRPVYQTRAVLQISGGPSEVIDTRGVAGVRPQAARRLQEQVRILRSRQLATRVVETLDLQKHPDLRAGPVLTPWERLRRMLPQGAVNEQPEEVDDGLPVSPAVAVFRSRITVEADAESGTLTLGFRSYEPDLSYAALNELVQSYQESLSTEMTMAGSQASSWLGERLEEQRKRVEKAKAALAEYEEKEGLAGLQDKIRQVEQQLAVLNRTLLDAQTERIAREADLERARRMSSPETAELPFVQSQKAVQRYQEQIADLQRQRARLGDTLGERHPDMVRLNESLVEAESALAAEVQRAVKGLDGAIAEAQRKEQAVEAAIAPVQQELTELRRRTGEQSLLKSEIEANEQMFNRLMGRATEANVASALKLENIEIVEPPERPSGPESPRRMRNLQIAFLGGLLAGLFLALLVEQLDGTIKTPEDLKAHFDLAFLGMVPEVGSPRGTVGPPSVLIARNPRSTLAESYRVIRTNLLFSAPQQGQGQVVLVSSVSPAEGKSTTSTNVAASLAFNGHRVALIDADLRRPVLHTLLGVPSAPGLSEYVIGKATLEEVVRPSGIDKLDLVPCGYLPPNPAELLGSARMREFLNRLRAEYEWVVVDAPPFLAMADAAVLSPVVDGVILVVASERTPKSGLARVVDQLGSVGGRIAGVILNRVDLERNSFYFGKYYGEYYRSYYSESGARSPTGSPDRKAPKGRDL